MLSAALITSEICPVSTDIIVIKMINLAKSCNMKYDGGIVNRSRESCKTGSPGWKI